MTAMRKLWPMPVISPNRLERLLSPQRPKQAVDGADAIYTDAWTSMGHEHEEQQRTSFSRPTN